MPDRILWDGREPITDALERFQVRDDFQRAVDGSRREESIRILLDIGADEITAWRMIEVLIPGEPPVVP
jgi:hypothetical protein